MHIRTALSVNHFCPYRWINVHVPNNEGYPRTRRECRSRQSNTLFAATLIADITHRIPIFLGPTCTNDNVPSSECASIGMELGLQGIKNFLWSRKPALSTIGPCQRTCIRIKNNVTAVAQALDIGSCCRVLPHLRMHSGGEHHRARSGQKNV